jgi:hypothetical protein
VADPDTRRAEDVVPLRRTIHDAEVRLELPSLEPLTAAMEAEAVELLAALFAGSCGSPR